MRWSHCSSCKLRSFVVAPMLKLPPPPSELAVSIGLLLFLHQKTIIVQRYVVVMAPASPGKYNITLKKSPEK